MASDEERRFRLRPRKPAARTERIALASAYKTIMHYARMTSQRRRSGGQDSGRTSSDALYVLLTQKIQPQVSGEPMDVTSPAKALRTRLIRGQSDSMPLKNRSTSQRSSKVGKGTTTSGYGS